MGVTSFCMPTKSLCHSLRNHSVPATHPQAHRLTLEFPEALYELLCTLQEGRRLNDQRCSFSMEKGIGRRRCHSEPNASRPAPRGRNRSRVRFEGMRVMKAQLSASAPQSLFPR